MKKNNIITLLFPTLFMTIIAIILCSNIFHFNELPFKGLLIISLIFIFPLLFLIQGIISSINNTNIVLSIGVSTVAFIILMLIYLNSSAIIYIFIYLIFGIIGYVITHFIRKKINNNLK